MWGALSDSVSAAGKGVSKVEAFCIRSFAPNLILYSDFRHPLTLPSPPLRGGEGKA